MKRTRPAGQESSNIGVLTKEPRICKEAAAGLDSCETNTASTTPGKNVEKTKWVNKLQGPIS